MNILFGQGLRRQIARQSTESSTLYTKQGRDRTGRCQPPTPRLGHLIEFVAYIAHCIRHTMRVELNIKLYHAESI